MKLTNENEVGELRSQKLAETLSNLVGLVVTFKEEKWDDGRKIFKKSYVSKGISAIELELEPVRHISISFTDGTSANYFSFDNLEPLIGQFGEYGSIVEYLKDKASTLFH